MITSVLSMIASGLPRITGGFSTITVGLLGLLRVTSGFPMITIILPRIASRLPRIRNRMTSGLQVCYLQLFYTYHFIEFHQKFSRSFFTSFVPRFSFRMIYFYK